MSEEIEAVFENGVFKPSESVDLPDGQRVRLSIAPAPSPAGDAQGQLAAWRAVFDGLSESDVVEIEQIALDRAHFIPPRRSGRAR